MAFAGSNGSGLTVSANSKFDGMIVPVSREKPSVSAWFTPLRSMARLAARRTFTFAQGDLPSHCSGTSSQNGASSSTGTSFSPAARLSSSATGPVNR